MTMFNKQFASQEFLIGKALSEEDFRKAVAPYLSTIQGLTEQHAKLLQALSQSEFSFESLAKDLPVLRLATELWDRHDAHKMQNERLAKLQ